MIGHTDTVGSKQANQALSLDRANSIKNLLESMGHAQLNIDTIGRGELELIVPTPDETAEPQNRRVELVVW